MNASKNTKNMEIGKKHTLRTSETMFEAFRLDICKQSRYTYKTIVSRCGAIGDVSERRRWRMQRGTRSGRGRNTPSKREVRVFRAPQQEARLRKASVNPKLLLYYNAILCI